MGDFDKAGYNREKPIQPALNPTDIYGILPKSRAEQYDMMEIIKRIIDDSTFDEYKAGYGQTLITGYARIDGWAVGIVANQRLVSKTKKAKCNLAVLSILILQIKPLDLLPIVTKENTSCFYKTLPVLW